MKFFSGGRYRDLPIRVRIILVYSFIALSTVIIISILGYNRFSFFLKSESVGKMKIIREQKVHEISAYMGSLLREIDAMASSRQIIASLALHRSGFESLQGPGSHRNIEDGGSNFDFLREMKARMGYHDIFLISNRGDIFFSVAMEDDSGTNLVSGRYRDTELGRAFRLSQDLLETIVSRISFYPPSGKPAMFLTKPVIINDQLVGYITVQVNIDTLYDKITDLTGLKATGETVFGTQISDNQVLIIAPLRHRSDVAFKMKIHKDSSLGRPLQQAVAGLSGEDEVVDYRGVPVLAAWTYLPELQAGMVIKIDSSEVFAPLAIMRATILIISVVILLVTVGASILLSGSIANPITQLMELMEAYRGGDRNIRSSIDSADEIGRLSTAFNALADRIDAYNSEVREQNIQLERRVEERTATLLAANEEIKSFAYIVSHDLRAPLVNIRGFSSELNLCVQDVSRIAGSVRAGLQQGDQDTLNALLENEIPEAMRFIASSVGKMDRMLSAILKLSRFGHRQLHLEEINMRELVSGTVASLAYQLESTRTKIIAEDLPVISNDRLVVEQIMGNLIDNAVKYLFPDRPGRIEISAAQTASGTTFSVQDNGIGISDSEKDKVFQIFRRGSHRGIEGEGMGLVYVQTLVKSQGGNISYESVVGEGTRFSVFLPSGLKSDDDPV